MSVAAWDGFLNDQSNWPAASRIGNATGATTARDTLGDKTFVKRKRMSQEERHLQILQGRRQNHRHQGVLGHVVAEHLRRAGHHRGGVVPLHLLEGRSAQHGAVGMLRHHRCRRIQRGDGRHRRRRRAPRLLLPALLPEHRAVQSAAPRARAAVFGAERRGAEPLAPGPRFLHRPPFAPMGDDLLDELAAAAGRGRGTVLRPVHPGDERHGRSAVPLAG